MKTAIYKILGNPVDVLEAIEVSARSPRPGEVLVDVLSAPIHNADARQIMGLYGKLAKPPATPGGEAMGRVVAVGAGEQHLAAAP